LDKHLTSVYDFYQFWLNQSDEDDKKFIKLFTLLSKEEIEHLIEEHDKAPHNRLLQKRLAEEVTIMIHSKEECDKVISASNVLFGGGSIDTFKGLDDDTIMSIFDGCPIHSISKEIIGDGIKLISLCTDIAPLFQSKGDLRKLIKNNGISINKEKVSDTDLVITMDNFINDKFLIVQQGKKNYNLIYID
jgi:tyrosyl-tRNA synthetase